MELEDVLGDKEPEVVADPPADTPVPDTPEPKEPAKGNRKAFQEKEAQAQAEGRARGPDGKFVAPEKTDEPAKEEPKVEKQEPETKPASQEMTEKERGLLARAQAETAKRQQLERENALLRAQQTPKEPAAPAEPEKTFWDDPEGYLKQFQQTVTQGAHQTVIQARLEMTEAAARAKYPDFEEKVSTVFAQLLQTTPGLHQHWLKQPDPAEFAYRTAKNIEELRQAGSVDSIKEQAEKAARIKWEAEQKAKEDAIKKQRDDLPDSVSNARGSSGQRITWGGPPPLDNILEAK